MEYIKNNRGLDKTILVRKNEGKDLETLKKLSLDKDIKVYLHILFNTLYTTTNIKSFF